MAYPKHTPALWWAIPNGLAGTPCPFLHPERRESLGGPLDAYDDEMRPIWEAGVRSVICLLNIPSDTGVFESAGIRHLCVPIPDGGTPTPEDVDAILTFYETCPRAVAVHCAAGLGRTGTVIAMLLINAGKSFEEAVAITRKAQPAAIETVPQVRFLQKFAAARS